MKKRGDLLDRAAKSAREEILNDPRWDELAEGTISDNDLAELRALAARSNTARHAFEAFLPIGEEARERVLERVRAMSHEESPDANDGTSNARRQIATSTDTDLDAFEERLKRPWRSRAVVRFAYALAAVAAAATVVTPLVMALQAPLTPTVIQSTWKFLYIPHAIEILGNLAMLAVALLVVRRRRRSTARFFVAAAIFQLIAVCVPLANAVYWDVFGRRLYDPYQYSWLTQLVQLNRVIQITTYCARAGAFLCLLVGIIQLASTRPRGSDPDISLHVSGRGRHARAKKN